MYFLAGRSAAIVNLIDTRQFHERRARPDRLSARDASASITFTRMNEEIQGAGGKAFRASPPAILRYLRQILLDLSKRHFTSRNRSLIPN